MSKLYEKSGVNLTQAHKLNQKLSKSLNLNAFAGMLKLPELKEYSIVTCCDGIGSKIIPLYERKMYKTIAIDTVAANLNDLVCSGAKAVGFVDYLALNKLCSDSVYEIVEGLNSELKKCGCELLGGETSELPELISQNNMDISGFAIGLLKEDNRLEKENVKKDDVVIGLVSSGIHANGFSLVRKLFKEGKLTEKEFSDSLAPTYVYYNCVSQLVEKKLIKVCANVTGGGILSNLNRVLPLDLKADLDFSKIPPQEIYEKLKSICADEMYEVFNSGVGFCLVADEENIDEIFETTKEFAPFVLGKVK